MATPTVSASLNKSVYSPGEQMLLTVQYGDTDNQVITVTITVADSQGHSSEPYTLTTLVSDPVTVAVSDTGNRVWTKQSDTGAVAVYSAVA